MKPMSNLPPGLYRSRPRPTRLTGAGRALAVTAALLCLSAPLVGIALHRKAVTDRAERDAVLSSGIVTDGVVVRLKRESKDSKRATVYYAFSANGRAFESHAKVPIARWSALRAGATLPIRYADENPELNVPDGAVPGVMPAAMPYILSPLLLVIGVISWFGLEYQRRLLSDGRAVLAVIRNVKKQRTQHGGTILRVRYDFQLLNGATQTGSVQTGGAVPEVGSSIAVLYDADQPRRSRPYPLSLVRLAESD
jgi:hypothetical protein